MQGESNLRWLKPIVDSAEAAVVEQKQNRPNDRRVCDTTEERALHWYAYMIWALPRLAQRQKSEKPPENLLRRSFSLTFPGLNWNYIITTHKRGGDVTGAKLRAQRSRRRSTPGAHPGNGLQPTPTPAAASTTAAASEAGRWSEDSCPGCARGTVRWKASATQIRTATDMHASQPAARARRQ